VRMLENPEASTTSVTPEQPVFYRPPPASRAGGRHCPRSPLKIGSSTSLAAVCSPDRVWSECRAASPPPLASGSSLRRIVNALRTSASPPSLRPPHLDVRS
jgi:hypothetical protein